jgi:RNA polymerase sigma-70 factor (ECF subfamily)
MLQQLDRTIAPDRIADPTADRTAEQAADPTVARLRAGDQAEFARILTEWSPAMLRVAMSYVRGREAAEDVLQETWLAVLDGLPRFEGRASLRTWTFAILANRARSRAVREWRTVPWSQLAGEQTGPTVDPDRFQGSDDPFPGHWTTAGAPRRWSQPEDASLAGEARAEIGRALTQLPERQRVVVTLRDVSGLSSEETCELLGISAQNQRVLLHRGRARLRAALERYYRG